jgi:hypothetical protein
MKGYQRGMSRGAKARDDVVRSDIPLKNVAVTMTDATTAGSWGTAVVAGLPQGNILILGAVLSQVQLVKGSAALIDAFVATLALGSDPTADATLSAGEVDIIPATAQSAATGGTLTGARVVSTATQNGTIIDNTAGDKELNLNVTVPDASSTGNSSFTVNGVLHLAYIVLGDD